MQYSEFVGYVVSVHFDNPKARQLGVTLRDTLTSPGGTHRMCKVRVVYAQNALDSLMYGRAVLVRPDAFAEHLSVIGPAK